MARFRVVEGDLVAEDLVPGSMDDCVEKWQFVFEHIDEIACLGGAWTCALCRKYLTRCTNRASAMYREDCSGCPIYGLTGQKYCKSTPNEIIENELETSNPDVYKLRELARDELFMLIALRDNRLEIAKEYLTVANSSGRNPHLSLGQLQQMEAELGDSGRDLSDDFVPD